MALVNGATCSQYRHKEILINSSLKATKKKELAMVLAKLQVSNPEGHFGSLVLQ